MRIRKTERQTGRHLAAVVVLVTVLAVGCTNEDSTEPPPVDETGVTTDVAEPDPASTTATTSTSTTEAEVETFDLQNLADAAAIGDPGAVLLAVGQAGGLRAAASGTDGDGNPVDPSMAWEGASLSKMIVATAVMQLVDQGLVDLDAPISDYVDFAISSEVTVRDVLRHGSGIPNLTAQLDACPSVETIELMKAAAEASTGPTEPGDYSNSNYILLGYMVSEITGTDIGAYTRDNVFVPLAMTSTYWWETQSGPAPYWRLPLDQPGAVSPFSCPDIEQTVGTEGLTFVTSLNDMDTFLRGLFAGQLVSPESLSEMLPDEGREVGLGVWAIEEEASGSRLYGHFGGRRDFSAQVFFDPEIGKSVVVYGTDIDTETLLWEAWGASPDS